MTLRKYLAGITLLFGLLGLVLVILGNDLAWMFFIIAGFVGWGTFSISEVTPEREKELDQEWDKNTWATHPDNPASPTYDDGRN